MWEFKLGNFFAQLQICRSIFAKQLKNEDTVLNVVFEGFSQTSILSLISTVPGIIDLSRPQSKVLSPKYLSESPFKNLKKSCEIMIMEIQPELLKKMNYTIKKSHNRTHFCQLQLMKIRMRGTCFGIFLTSNIIHRWNFQKRPQWKTFRR